MRSTVAASPLRFSSEVVQWNWRLAACLCRTGSRLDVGTWPGGASVGDVNRAEVAVGNDMLQKRLRVRRAKKKGGGRGRGVWGEERRGCGGEERRERVEVEREKREVEREVERERRERSRENRERERSRERIERERG